MTDAEELPVRYCHGCGKHDDAPRVHCVADMGRVASDELYHYDCAPQEVLDEHPHVAALAKSGKQGADLRGHAAHYASKIKEDPADKEQNR